MSERDKTIDSLNNRDLFGKTKKTVTRTFRISAEWDNFLRKESESQGISVNVLMNLILRRHAHIYRLAQADNLICLTKTTFRKIIEGIPLEYLSRTGGDISSKDFPNILGILGLPSDYDSFAYLVSRYFGCPNGAMWFCCHRHTQKNTDVFHLQHNLGRKWSVFLREFFLFYLKTLNIKGEAKVYDNAVNIKVLRPKLARP